MAPNDIEQELTRILYQVEGYKNRNQVEELTYLAGAALGALISMGCPAEGLLKLLTTVVDQWANYQQAPARS